MDAHTHNETLQCPSRFILCFNTSFDFAASGCVLSLRLVDLSSCFFFVFVLFMFHEILRAFFYQLLFEINTKSYSFRLIALAELN